MREHRRAAWALTRLAFRADATRAAMAYALFFIRGAGSALDAWWLGRLIDAVVAGDVDRAALIAVALAMTSGVTLGAALVDLDFRFRVEEATGLLIDRELIDTMAATTTLDLHERPVHLDRIEVLRTQKGQVSQSVSAILEFLAVVATAGTSFALLASVHPLLLLVALGGGLGLWTSARQQIDVQRTTDSTAERRRRAAHLFRIATEAAPAKEVRTFGLAQELVRRHDEQFGSACDELERLGMKWGVLSGLAWSTLGMLQIASIGFVAWRAVEGDASIGDVVLVVMISDRLNAMFQQGVGMVTWLFGSLRAAGRYLQVMDAAREVAGRDDPWEPAQAPDRLQRGIDLDRVSFRYPDTDTDVLRDLSLHVPPSSIVAIVGENGAGKSTLVKLLGRYYEPTAGTIAVDGVDLRRIDAAAWRARLSGAFQDHARFELLTREVVGIGDLRRLDDTAAVEDALARAGGAELPARLDRGLETPLGRSFDDGIEPSGGQWQQLALGRALLRERPLLLLLDEPTSALDPDAEHALFESYAAAARAASAETGAITLLVSHRFSTVRMADLIVVLADGAVAQAGTHDELMAAGGTYAELFRLQARAYR